MDGRTPSGLHTLVSREGEPNAGPARRCASVCLRGYGDHHADTSICDTVRDQDPPRSVHPTSTRSRAIHAWAYRILAPPDGRMEVRAGTPHARPLYSWRLRVMPCGKPAPAGPAVDEAAVRRDLCGAASCRSCTRLTTLEPPLVIAPRRRFRSLMRLPATQRHQARTSADCRPCWNGSNPRSSASGYTIGRRRLRMWPNGVSELCQNTFDIKPTRAFLRCRSPSWRPRCLEIAIAMRRGLAATLRRNPHHRALGVNLRRFRCSANAGRRTYDDRRGGGLVPSPRTNRRAAGWMQTARALHVAITGISLRHGRRKTSRGAGRARDLNCQRRGV